MSTRSYKDLDVWKKGLRFVGETYKLSTRFPTTEHFGLTTQIRRAAVSVVANIAEGNGRLHRGEYVHYLSIARGSVLEVEALLYTSIYLEYLGDAEATACFRLVDDTGRMLRKLIQALSRPGRPS